MAKYIDSSIVEYNEDGTQTITTIEHYTPPTTAQKLTGLAVLGVVTLSPVIFLSSVAAYEAWSEKRAAKKNAQQLKSV